MMLRLLLLAFVLFAPAGAVADRIDELTAQVEALATEVARLRAERARPAPAPVPLRSAVEPVDLDFAELPSLPSAEPHAAHVLARPWWARFHISGFGAAGIYDTGSGGTRGKGGFEIKEATLFIEADVWDSTSLFVELQTNRLGKDNQTFTRTGEVHVVSRNLLKKHPGALNVKVGRIDIPFGEEYLWQDSIDNPLITNSAAYVYGFDEGVEAFGTVGGIDYLVAVTDGFDERSVEENAGKAVSLKLARNFNETWFGSLSYMHNGDASISALEFGGSHLEPVGSRHVSSLGVSDSAEVGGDLGEANLVYRFATGALMGQIALSGGFAQVSDTHSTFDRSLRWMAIEPIIHFRNNWYLVGRYSEIGTTDDDEGYHFDGKTFAGGNASIGYDAHRFSRLALGLGWMPHRRMRVKFEIGRDHFELIPGSLLNPKNSDRRFAGAELAVRL